MMTQRSVLLGLAALSLLPALCGCGAGDVALNENDTIMPVDTAKQARTYFEKANGDYEALSAADKQAYLDLFNGDQTRADATWNIMKNPPNPGVPSGAN